MTYAATISFKIAPDYYAVVKAMAAGQRKSVSEFVRETVEQALELEQEAERLAALFADHFGGVPS